MKFDILTLFPDFFNSPLESSIINKAREKGIFSSNIVNIRDFSNNKHNTVDDRPFGGGCGMVMKAEPIFSAIKSLKNTKNTRVVLTSPSGKRYNQKLAFEFSKLEHIIIICGHYEGIDERVKENLITDELSIGDYVLTGGEIPALIFIDSIVRLLPNVLGNKESAIQDSFTDGLLDYPHYTRPREFDGHKVPDVLFSGNHQKISEWREKQKLRRTLKVRPDLLKSVELNELQIKYLNEIKKEYE